MTEKRYISKTAQVEMSKNVPVINFVCWNGVDKIQFNSWILIFSTAAGTAWSKVYNEITHSGQPFDFDIAMKRRMMFRAKGNSKYA